MNVLSGISQLYFLDIYNKIIEKYGEPHRYYHNFNHIKYMFGVLNKFKDLLVDSERDYSIIVLSVLFHDVVYDPKSKTNESDSADYMLDCLQGHVNTYNLKVIYDNIMGTKDHLNPESKSASVLFDLDLCILGTSWKEYDKYRQGIYQEYCLDYPNIPILMKQKRIEFLKSFLGRDVIYHNHFFRSILEDKARKNITKEIEILQS